MYSVRCAVALGRSDLFVFVDFCALWENSFELQVISFRGEALRFRPRPSRLARNNYEHAYMHCEHSHWAQNAMGMRVAFTPHFRERKLPLRAWAGRAVLARRVRALAGT